MSQYVKFTYERERAHIAPFDELAELNACRRKLLDLGLIGVDSNGIGFGNLSVRNGTSRNFYITGSATVRFAQIVAARLRASGGVRFRKELDPLRRRYGSFIRVVNTCRDLRIRSTDICSDPLSRLGFVGDASRSRPDDFEARSLWHAGNGIRNHRCAKQDRFSSWPATKAGLLLLGRISKTHLTL